jgi:hypothetical protein
MKIIDAINYLYFRFYRIIKSVSLKTSYYQVRVVFFFSMITGCNLATVFKLADLEINLNRYYVTAIGLIWFFFWLLFFSKSTSLESTIKRFEKETGTHRLIGGMVLILYSVASFIIFINVMAN